MVELSPKTEKGVRTIALDGATAVILSEHRESAQPHDDDLVFTQADGSAIHPERFSRRFARRFREVGLPPIRLHDVRHSYVTALIGAGVPLKVVSQRVGHASPVITMTLYQHVLPSDDRAAAETGARTIFGPGEAGLQFGLQSPGGSGAEATPITGTAGQSGARGGS